MPRKKSLRDVPFEPGARVIVRVDYNVPLHARTRAISDDSRIRESLPTIRYLRERGCRVALCSHLGRPKGRRDEAQSLKPVARRLSQMLSGEARFVEDCVGDEAEAAVESMASGEVSLLENLRFHHGEESNDPDFARSLARLADYYVNDGFGAAHRRHASTAAITDLLPSAAGFLMEREIEALRQVTERPRHPYAVAIGGAKVADKIAVIENLFEKVDTFLIGGGMAASFLSAAGAIPYAAGVDCQDVKLASHIMDLADARGGEIALPTDVVVSDRFAADAEPMTARVGEIPPSSSIMDIGPQTVREYRDRLAQAGTVVWNGPMGVFEWARFAQGTRGIAHAIADLDSAYSVVGGGSTADAVRSLHLAGRFSHVSTGGGATLEYLEGRDLPGIAALPDV